MMNNRICRCSGAYYSKRLFSLELKRAVSEKDNVLLQEVGNTGVIILNRPKALNALNTPMVQNIYAALKHWESSMKSVIIKGTDSKVFCAGGDVKSLVLEMPKDRGFEDNADYVRKLYTLNHLIGTYQRPYIAIIDGLTMGAGAGISVHGKYRIATENTLFAMPETAIGFNPDVGSTYFLSRLEGKLGMFLALTGYRLKGIDVLHAGLATHYIHSAQVEAVIDDVLKENSSIDEVLETHTPKNSRLKFSLGPHVDLINECFSAATVEEILESLKGKNSKFAQNLVEQLHRMSPTALKITKKAIEDASEKSLAEALITEYRLSCRVLNKSSDFAEGVRALLIEKDNTPIWNFRTLEEVLDVFVNEQFEPLSPDVELILPRNVK